MSSVFRCFICRNCSAAAAQKLQCKTPAIALSRVHSRVRLQHQHLSSLLLPAFTLASQHSLQTRSTGHSSLASTRCTTRRLGSMADTAVKDDTESEQALRPLRTNGHVNGNASELGNAMPKAASRKRSRDADADSNQQPDTVGAVAQAQLLQPSSASVASQPSTQQPLSSNVEDSVQEAADLLRSDSGLARTGSMQKAAEMLQQAGADDNPKQPRSKRAKPASAQAAASADQQALAEQTEDKLDGRSKKSKRAKVAQAVAAAKVMVEQEHTAQDPAIANAPLTEDHPVHRVSKKAAPPVVQAKPADAAPRIAEMFADDAVPSGAVDLGTTAERHPDGPGSTVAQAGKRGINEPKTTAASKRGRSRAEPVLPVTQEGTEPAGAAAREDQAPAVPKKQRGRAKKQTAAASADAAEQLPTAELSADTMAEPAAPKPRTASRRKVAAAAVVDVKPEAEAVAEETVQDPAAAEVAVKQDPAPGAAGVKQEPAGEAAGAGQQMSKEVADTVKQEPAASPAGAQQVPSWYVTDVSASRASEPAVPKPRKPRAKKAAVPAGDAAAESSDASAQAEQQPVAPKPRKSRAKKAATPAVKEEEPSNAEALLASAVQASETAAAAAKPRKGRAKKAAAPVVKEEPSTSEVSAEAGSESSDMSAAEDTPKPAAPKARKSRAKKAAAPPVKEEPSTSDMSAETTSEAAAASTAATKKPARSRKKVAAVSVKEEPATSDADAQLSAEESSQADANATLAKKKPARARKKATPKVKEEPSMSETSEEEVQVEGQASVKKVAKPRRRKFDNELTVRLLAAARAALAAPETVVIPPRPVPNLGYACLNTTLQLQKPPVTSNRGAILRTFEEKGLPHISQLALQNCKDLLPIVQWNHEHNIRLFRLSSDLFPWGDSGKYDLEELPDLPEIKEVLFEVGQLARLYKQRLTAHPSEFCKMAAPREEVLEKSILDLEVHSKVFDMLGYEPNLWNKMNIHIGGTYDDKQATLDRFAANFHRLSPNAQKRLAVENDDKATQWSITDLLPLHEKIGVPLTFDFHHHRFCDGGLTHEQAFKAAIATWPKGIRPQVHWSEEPEDPEKVRRAHSKYIKGPMNLYGHEADVDIMIEAKSKEMTLLDFRQYAEHEIQLPGAADDHDGKIYERIVKEKQDMEKLKLKEKEMQELQAAAAPFL